MRVALFTESYFPVVNGVSTSVHSLAQELCLMGHQPVVIAPYFPGFADAQETYPVRRLPSWRTPLNPNNPFAYPPLGRIPTILDDLTFDVVHTHHPFGIGLQGEFLAKRRSISLISTFHTLYMEYGHYVPFLPPPLVVAAVSRHLRRYYARCSAVIVPSRESGRRLEQIGVPESKLRIIPTGVPDALPVSGEAIEEARQDYEIPGDTPVVLFVGRLAREKNLDLLLEAFARLQVKAGKGGNAILVLAGDGPYRSGCEQLVENYQIGDQVRFTGFLSKAELAPLYAMATLFAFPSSSETQGVVLCEALSHGLPCVAVQGGGAPEFVRQGVDALVVPPNPRAFAGALTQLLENQAQRRAFSIAARQTPLRLTPALAAQKAVTAYEEARVSIAHK